MEYVSGNIFIRACRPDGMKAGEEVVGHRHNFDHTTYIKRGAFEVSLLAEDGVTPAWTRIVRASDDVNWVLILKGRMHRLVSIEDGSVYHCIYAHRLPQALTIHEPGRAPQDPQSVIDSRGVRWYRADDGVVDTSAWAEAYR